MEPGDVVLEPVNGDERLGIVQDILIPNSEKAIRFGVSSGGVLVKWDDWEGEVLLGLEVLQGPDYVFLVRRKSEVPKPAPAYCSGEPVEPGDVIARPKSEAMGVVVEVVLPHAAKAIWLGMHSGGAIIRWDGWPAEVSIGPDVLRREVRFVRRKSE